MGSLLETDGAGLRISNSPRRSPKITQDPGSPVRSVHPQMQQMDSIHNQLDLGHRTDWFEDSSEEGSAIGKDPDVAAEIDLLEHRGSATRKRHSNPPGEQFVTHDSRRNGNQDSGGYQRLVPTVNREDSRREAQTPSSSFNGSVDELLPGNPRSSPPTFQRSSRIPSGRTPRAPAHLEHSEDRLSKVDPALKAHAIAHDITLQALLRDENTLDRSMQSLPLAPVQAGNRSSLLTGSLRGQDDPRSPRYHTYSTPPSNAKKVHVVPPKIDTSAPRHSLPDDLIRTPYPYTPENIYRKDLGRSPTANTPVSPMESIVTLSIRRSNPNSKPRVSSITIPVGSDLNAVRSNSSGIKEQHFKALDFDDFELFQNIRKCYADIHGPMRFVSARSLSRITVSGQASKAADAGYGWLSQPRSPRVLAYKGLDDTFAEEKILQYFRDPALGRSRYAFVHWAHRLAAAPSPRAAHLVGIDSRAADEDLIRRREQPEGLEFVVSWSIARISIALGIVLVTSVAATLLWIFLGHSAISERPADGGFRDAGDRIVAGVVTGICILLVGISTIAGWIVVSWLAM